MTTIETTGLIPASITPFTEDDNIDHGALAEHGRWLAQINGVTGILCNGHAGEGLSLTFTERLDVVRTLVDAVDGSVPIIAGVGGEGSKVASLEAKAVAEAGASGVLLYPTHIWLRMGYQDGAPEDRYRMVAEESGLPLILFLYPDATKATYDLSTILRICSVPSVVAIKHGGRNMARWDTEIPIIRREFPDIGILTSHDEYLLHTLWESDGALLSYGAVIPELLIELIGQAKNHDYEAAKATYDRITPLTAAIYHRHPHIEATAALKVALLYRGGIPTATVRSPLLPLDKASVNEIHSALEHASIEPDLLVAR